MRRLPDARSVTARLRRSPRLAPARQHLPAATATAATLAAVAGHRRAGSALSAAAAAGFLHRYRHSRAEGRAATQEHVARMQRLRRDVLQRFYLECVGSMEAELEEYPAYDRRKHDLRYELVARTAIEHAPRGGTVVDVGCASALVLDRVREARGTRGIGFDLSPHGLHQRVRRPDAPALAQAVVESIPLRDGVADVVVFSEVIEHLVDAYVGLREVSRIMRDGGVMILTTNNGSEMPCISPLRDPLTWAERLAGRTQPERLAFRNLTWHDPIEPGVDPLPRSAPTYAPHIHFAFAELRDMARDAGFDLLHDGSFEFPAPQSPLADRLRRLTGNHPRLGTAAADALERAMAVTPGLRMMGTHHLLVFRKSRPPRPRPLTPWWPAHLPDNLPVDYLTTREEVARLVPEDAGRVLDVGCAAGALGLRLRERGARVTGIELDPCLARRAREVLDHVVEGDAAHILATGEGLDADGYDAVVFADCLEHLADPWQTLRDAAARLRPDGAVVVSLPNVRHWDTLWNLGARGVWPVRGVGIHDRGHLRFFTRRTAIAMLEEAGLRIDAVEPVHRVVEHRATALDRLAPRVPGALRELVTFQWLLVGRRA